MSSDPKLFRVNRENRVSESVREVEFSQLGLRERQDIQEWVAANPTILGDDLLIIGKEFSDFDRTNERLDLLAVDRDGKLVIIELKRDDSGADVHWQAIKYASYFARATATDIINRLSHHAGISAEEAESRLQQHLGADDLNALNNDQRIVLASHRFAPEVTNAVLWLNEKAPEETLITCVKLTPYQDGDVLYVQASRLIPVPDTEGLRVGIRDSSAEGRGGFSPALRQSDSSHRQDHVTRFLWDVAGRAKVGLSYELKPDRQSRWARKASYLPHGSRRYLAMWYSRVPWDRNRIRYRIDLFQIQSEEPSMLIKRLQAQGVDNLVHPGAWVALVYFATGSEHNSEAFRTRLNGLKIDDHQVIPHGDWGCNIEVVRGSDALDDDFAGTLAATLRRFIEVVTPVVDDFFENEGNEEEG